ncbi:unnamed protein product [Closterium sp. Naga37s-1]|nr:unnamed protein product [Closterium sp. Naga37s-1]
MELRLVSGVLKVQVEEMAGDVGERVGALEAKLREQGDAMAAMQSDMADMRRTMAQLKGMAATGASAEGAEKGSASGEASEGIGAQPLNGAWDYGSAAFEVKEVKPQVDAARRAAGDTASEMRGEMGALKAELAQWRAAAERQAAEVAYVKATVSHSEARINDVELALAALKDSGAGSIRNERRGGSAGEHEGPERRREGKKRKREAVGKNEGLVDAARHALTAAGGALPVETMNEVERQGGAQGVGNTAACNTDGELKGLRTRVEALETMSVVGGKTWELSSHPSNVAMAGPASRALRGSAP